MTSKTLQIRILYFFLFFCLIQAAVPLINSWTWDKNADSSEIGFRFYGHDYRTRKGYDLHQCALFCEQDRRCRSYNFLREENLCELCVTDRKSVDVPSYVQVGLKFIPTENGLISHPGSQYFSRHAITLLSKEPLPPCALSTCPENHACSSMSGGGHTCQKTTFTRTELISEGWNSWSSWSSCSKSCGSGTETRTRTCQSSEHKWSCIGRSSESRLCADNPQCPQWTHWGPWSDCDVIQSCGEGSQSRSRMCVNSVLPNHGSCNGNSKEVVTCRVPSCTAPTRLSGGCYGNALLYDDSNAFKPKWRQVCKATNQNFDDEDFFSIKEAICRTYGISATHENISSEEVALAQTFLEPSSCDVKATSLTQCSHSGLRSNVTCNDSLSLECTAYQAFRCEPEEELNFICTVNNNGSISLTLTPDLIKMSSKQTSMLSFFGKSPTPSGEPDVEDEGPTATKKKKDSFNRQCNVSYLKCGFLSTSDSEASCPSSLMEGQDRKGSCQLTKFKDCFAAQISDNYIQPCGGKPSREFYMFDSFHGNPCLAVKSFLSPNHSCVYKISSFYAGMKDGSVADGDITASSYYRNLEQYGPRLGRLDFHVPNDRTGQWLSGLDAVGSWLQVDFKDASSNIFGVVTQGRGIHIDYVKSFKISYGNNVKDLQIIKRKNGEDMVFNGNYDIHSHVVNFFPQQVQGRYFRLTAVTTYGLAALRMEYLRLNE